MFSTREVNSTDIHIIFDRCSPPGGVLKFHARRQAFGLNKYNEIETKTKSSHKPVTTVVQNVRQNERKKHVQGKIWQRRALAMRHTDERRRIPKITSLKFNNIVKYSWNKFLCPSGPPRVANATTQVLFPSQTFQFSPCGKSWLAWRYNIGIHTTRREKTQKNSLR